MQVSVITLAFNQAESLPVILPGLSWSELHRVIVVDKGSQDHTADVAARGRAGRT